MAYNIKCIRYIVIRCRITNLPLIFSPCFRLLKEKKENNAHKITSIYLDIIIINLITIQHLF